MALTATSSDDVETAAITWPVLDMDAGTVEVRGTVIRLPGQGLIIKPKPKSKAGWRVIELPSWAVTMLRRRRDDYEPNRWDVVFTSPSGMLRDPSNTQADLRDVVDRGRLPGHHVAHLPAHRRHPHGSRRTHRTRHR